MRPLLKLAFVAVLVLAVLGSCGCALDRSTADHRAAVMCGAADKINSGTVEDLKDNALDFAWIFENERRASVNFSDALGWRKPTYKYPAKRPTTLPYTPVDDVPEVQP